MKTLSLALLCLASLVSLLGTVRADALRFPQVGSAATHPVALAGRDDDGGGDDEEEEEDYRRRGAALADLLDPGARRDSLRSRVLLHVR